MTTKLRVRKRRTSQISAQIIENLKQKYGDRCERAIEMRRSEISWPEIAGLLSIPKRELPWFSKVIRAMTGSNFFNVHERSNWLI